MAEPLVLINAFEVPREEAERFIATWEKMRDLASQPGYVDTARHEAVTPGADLQFVNIARWQSAVNFQAATQSPGFRSPPQALLVTARIRAFTGSCAHSTASAHVKPGARDLARRVVEFPGDHSGFVALPEQFGSVLHQVLADTA